jgi:cytidylate kinase
MIMVISGVMAAGKSTVARLPAESLDESVHLRGDIFGVATDRLKSDV